MEFLLHSDITQIFLGVFFKFSFTKFVFKNKVWWNLVKAHFDQELLQKFRLEDG